MEVGNRDTCGEDSVIGMFGGTVCCCLSSEVLIIVSTIFERPTTTELQFRTYIELNCRHALVYTSNDLLRDAVGMLVARSTKAKDKNVRNRVNVVHIQAIAKLLDTCSDLQEHGW